MQLHVSVMHASTLLRVAELGHHVHRGYLHLTWMSWPGCAPTVQDVCTHMQRDQWP